MKMAMRFLFLTVVIVFAHGQGQIIFKNVGVQKADGSGFYNVPLYEDPRVAGNSTTGAGLFPGGVIVGLFLPTSITPLATGLLGTTPQTAPYIATPIVQTVTVPGFTAGSTVPLIIRAWSASAGSFAEVQATPGMSWSAWSVTSQPLGGTPPGGGLPIIPPTLTGWGPESGAGLIVAVSPEPLPIHIGVFGLVILTIASRRSRSAPRSIS